MLDDHDVVAGDRFAVLTGAGLSTDSGIPDYRGPGGVWTRDPQAARLSTLRDYVADPEVRRRSWQARTTHPVWTAVPNAAHRALVELEHSGRLAALLTQNIDELHRRAGSSPRLLVELHGTVWRAVCLTCGSQTAMVDELARVVGGDLDPPCTACGGILKSATISFGQSLDAEVLRRAVRYAASADLFLAVGSSLTVQPAAGLCDLARQSGARLVIVNAEPTAYDHTADAVLRGRVEEVLPRLVRAVSAARRSGTPDAERT